MRHFALSFVAAFMATVASLAVLVPTGSQAQAPAQAPAPCGPVAYSAAEQKYVGIPCTAPTQKAEAGKPAPCGPVAYSQAEQKYVGVPCTAPAPQAEAGKAAPCGPVAYSNAEQKYVGVPCTQRTASVLKIWRDVLLNRSVAAGAPPKETTVASSPARSTGGTLFVWRRMRRAPNAVPSDDFHVAVEFPVRDGLAELPLFPFACCRIVIDEGVAEQFARRLGGFQPPGRLHQRAR